MNKYEKAVKWLREYGHDNVYFQNEKVYVSFRITDNMSQLADLTDEAVNMLAQEYDNANEINW